MKHRIFVILLILFPTVVSSTPTIDVSNGQYRYVSSHWDKTSASYRSFNSQVYRSYQTEQTRIRSLATGAVSNGTVKATITREVNKRAVMGAVLDKARQGGQLLGKGAMSVGRFAVSRNPYVLAFNLAVTALTLSPYFWSEENGDFVKEKDDNTYIVFVMHDGSLFSPPDSLDKSEYNAFCRDKKCQLIGYVKGYQAAYAKGVNYCSTVKVSERFFGNGISSGHSVCAYNNFYVSNDRIAIVRWKDYIPINLDEFIKEGESTADENATEWVKTSGVQPQDEPKVSVPVGTIAQTAPYTDPKDGKAKQTRFEFEKDNKVKETTIERPDLTPNSPEAPPAEAIPDDPTSSKPPKKDKEKGDEQDSDKEADPPLDICKEYPDILACQKMGDVQEGFFDDINIPHIVDNQRYQKDNFLPFNGSCPAPKNFHVMGKEFKLSYEPICVLLQKIRFAIILGFIVMSMLIVFHGLKKE